MSVLWQELEQASHAELVRLCGAEASLRKQFEEALRRIVAWDECEKPHKNLPLLDCADLARKALQD